MQARLSPRSPDERLRWLGYALVLALVALAYRPLFWNALRLPTSAQLEGWMFRPSQLPPPLILAVSAWFFWRRRARLLSLPVVAAPLAAALWLALGAALFVWAQLTRASELFLPSLAAQLLGFAALTRGRAGCRVVVLPAFALLLGLQIPGPLQDEILWQLQLASAASASWLLEMLGSGVVHGGVILHVAGNSFHVIDGCSGLRGIEILTLVALLVRELFAYGGWRVWLLLPIAPVLGFALNAVRIAFVATSSDAEALPGMQSDHTPQGLAVLFAGTAILYGVGLALAGSRHRVNAAPAPADAVHATPSRLWWLAAGWLVGLVGIALVVPPFEQASRAAERRPKFQLAEQGSGWVSEPLTGDPMFFGAGPQPIHRRYQAQSNGSPRAAGDAIEVFVGFEAIGSPTSNPMLSSKLEWPDPNWSVESREQAPIWVLQRDAELTIAKRPPGEERAVIYSWRSGDRGLWRESLRSLLALDATPFARERPRTAVRIVAFAPHGGELALDRARQRLDSFIAAYREELAAF